MSISPSRRGAHPIVHLAARMRDALSGRPKMPRERRAVSVWHPWQWQDVFAQMTPARVAFILRSVAQSTYLDEFLELAEQIEERDLHYKSVLQQRRLAVSNEMSELMPGDASARARRIADDVQRLVNSPKFTDMKLDLLDAQGKGFAAVEVMWERTMGGLRPVAYERIDPRWLTFDQNDGKTLLLRDYGAGTPEGTWGGRQAMIRGGAQINHGQPLPERKIITHIPKTKSGLPARGGMAYSVITMTMLKSIAVRDWWAYAEVFGLPLRVGKYGQNATDADIQTLISAVSNLASDAGAVMPDSMAIEFPTALGAGSRNNDLFEKMTRWADEQTSKAVVGVTMTSDAGSSMAQAQVHFEVRRDLVEDDQRQLLNSINDSLIRWYVDLRHGPQADYPRLIRPKDDQVDIEALSKAVAMGVKVPENWLRERMGIPDPAPDEDVLPGRPPGGVSGDKGKGTRDNLHLLALPADEPDFDTAEWRRLSTRTTKPLARALARAESADEFIALAAAAGVPEQAANDLTLAAFKARVDGETDTA